MVVDSEGFIYGYVKDFHFVDNMLYLSVYTVFKVNELSIDVEKLTDMLKTKTSLSGNEPLEFLVNLARREGLDIPYRVAEKDFEWVKGFVPVNEVQLIDVKKISVDEMDTVVKVVVLSTPREAVFRGIPIQNTKPIYRFDQVLNKLVISLSRGVLGICKEVVVGAGSAGFRVYRARSIRRVINWIAFTSNLKKQGYRDVYEKLVDFKDPYRFNKVDTSIVKDLENILKDFKEKDKVLSMAQNYVEVEVGAVEFEDIAYEDVVKVGDIVIAV